MAKIITIVLALVMVLLDYIAYKRLKKIGARKSIIYTFCSVVIFSYIIILMVPVFMFALIDTGNNQFMMKFSMAILTGYLFFSVSRLVLYAFWLPSKSKKWMWTGIGISSFLMLTFLYSALVTRTDYQVKEVELKFSNLPVSFNGYRVAFISDIHIGSMWNAEHELEILSDIVSSTDADLVLFGGDLVNLHYTELTPQILNILSKIKGVDGVFAVMGNHDTGSYVKGSTKEFRAENMASLAVNAATAGWLFLRDSTAYIRRGTDSIAITGIDYSEKLQEYKHSLNKIDGYDVSGIYKNVPDSMFNITLSHLPQLWHSISDKGYSDLTLSGHIHGMQMKIGSLSPASLMYDEWSGLYENENGKLYINDGIGSVGIFARIGARPEVTVITLKSI